MNCRLKWAIIVSLCLGASLSSPAFAQDAKPWDEGVTDEHREKAKPFFEAGNEFFQRSMYAKALGEYEKALVHRAHPAIRYNLAICLIHLGRPVEAYENLVAGMRYGPGPLADGLHKEGETYLRLLRDQLAEVRIVTKEKGARVTLNGKELFVGPGEVTLMVKPEKLLVRTIKEGMLSDNRELTPKTSGTNLISIALLPLSAGIVMKQRWPTWKPWATVGVGAALAAAGTPFFFSARQNMKEYDNQIGISCVEGCAPSALPQIVSSLKSRAEWQDLTALSLFASGGAVLATGVVLLVLNRPYAVQSESAPQRRGLLDARNFRLEPRPGAEGGVMSSYHTQF